MVGVFVIEVVSVMDNTTGKLCVLRLLIYFVNTSEPSPVLIRVIFPNYRDSLSNHHASRILRA